MQELIQITLEDDSAGTETVFVQQLSDRRFVLADTPVMTGFQDAQIHAGDVVGVEPTKNGHFRITGVERSDALHYDFGVPREFVESEEFAKFCDEVTAAGGTWERVMGGLLYVHLPPLSDFNAKAALARRIALAGPSQGGA